MRIGDLPDVWERAIRRRGGNPQRPVFADMWAAFGAVVAAQPEDRIDDDRLEVVFRMQPADAGQRLIPVEPLVGVVAMHRHLEVPRGSQGFAAWAYFDVPQPLARASFRADRRGRHRSETEFVGPDAYGQMIEAVQRSANFAVLLRAGPPLRTMGGLDEP